MARRHRQPPARAAPRWPVEAPRAGLGRSTRLGGRDGTAAGGSRGLARGMYPELAPEQVGLRHELGFGKPAARNEAVAADIERR